MRNKLRLFGIVAAVAVIGLSVMSCGGDDDDDVLAGRVVAPDLRGEWVEATITAGVAAVVPDGRRITIHANHITEGTTTLARDVFTVGDIGSMRDFRRVQGFSSRIILHYWTAHGGHLRPPTGGESEVIPGLSDTTWLRPE